MSLVKGSENVLVKGSLLTRASKNESEIPWYWQTKQFLIRWWYSTFDQLIVPDWSIKVPTCSPHNALDMLPGSWRLKRTTAKEKNIIKLITMSYCNKKQNWNKTNQEFRSLHRMLLPSCPWTLHLWKPPPYKKCARRPYWCCFWTDNHRHHRYWYLWGVPQHSLGKTRHEVFRIFQQNGKIR